MLLGGGWSESKGDFSHKASLRFEWGDTVEILIPIERERPVYGTVISVSDPDFPEDEVDDVLVVVGSDLYSFRPRDIGKVLGKV